MRRDPPASQPSPTPPGPQAAGAHPWHPPDAARPDPLQARPDPLPARPDPLHPGDERARRRALENANRRAVLDYIAGHPGPTFREIVRATGVAAGTVRHHLGVLKRTGLVIEHRFRSTVRLFENEPRYRDGWRTTVVLREGSLQHLHAWLEAHPGRSQKEILDNAQAWDWSRSTTQHRLKRLADEGLVEIVPHGRLKLYHARSEVREPTAGGAWGRLLAQSPQAQTV